MPGKRYLTVFGFTRNVVTLVRYGDASHVRESGIQRTGIQVHIRDASQIVTVIERRAAWTAGLRDGDRIFSVRQFDLPH